MVFGHHSYSNPFCNTTYYTWTQILVSSKAINQVWTLTICTSINDYSIVHVYFLIELLIIDPNWKQLLFQHRTSWSSSQFKVKQMPSKLNIEAIKIDADQVQPVVIFSLFNQQQMTMFMSTTTNVYIQFKCPHFQY